LQERIFFTPPAKCERLNVLFRADIRSASYGFGPEAGFYVQQQQLAPVRSESRSAAIRPQIKRAYIES